MNTIPSWDDSIRKFLQQTGSSMPTPGGGSVAAIVAVLGTAMTTMVANLSLGDKFADIRAEINLVIEQMGQLSVECEELFLADMTSFNKYMDTLNLPKNTDEEKLIRKKELHEATINAIEVPLRLMEVCKNGLDYLSAISELSNKNVISDLGIGAILYEAAAESALLTVEINLVSLKDPVLKRQYTNKISTLMQDITALKSKVLLVTRNRITR